MTDYPTEPNAVSVALEAGETNERATSMLAACWLMAENFTGRSYIADADPTANVVEAVRALALYQLIHSPARREFRTITAGDSTLSREALGPLFKMSGAGILLASEVQWHVATDTQEEGT
jgi:hypothetical protein